jgi:hypothetical protein
LTIAICCTTPEGVVLGADSTMSVMMPGGGFHYLNFNQKLFQIGETGTLNGLTWGLAGLGNLSHRTQFALLADDLAATPAVSVAEVAARWTDRFLARIFDHWRQRNSEMQGSTREDEL